MSPQAFTIVREHLKTPTSSTTLITGGSRGIGLETAKLLHSISETNNVVILDRLPPQDAATLTTSARYLFVSCDITSWSQQRDAFTAAVDKFGALDNVFVNAGLTEFEDQIFRDEYDSKNLLKEPDRRTIDVDIRALNDTVKLAVHHLRRRPTRGGNIVLTASIAGYLATTGAPLYSAAKHGVVGLMRALKNQTKQLGIAISVVAPGITLTPMVGDALPDQTLDDWASDARSKGISLNTPDQIADAVVWLFGQGIKANGMGILVQSGRATDIENGIAQSRKSWMGDEQLALFRGGSKTQVFLNKL